MRTLMYIFTEGIRIIHKNIHYYVSFILCKYRFRQQVISASKKYRTNQIAKKKKGTKEKIIIEINFNYVKAEKKDG